MSEQLQPTTAELLARIVALEERLRKTCSHMDETLAHAAKVIQCSKDTIDLTMISLKAISTRWDKNN